VEAATVLVVTVNGAVVEPAAIVTLPGTAAAAVLLLVRVTTAPPAGAAGVSVTLPKPLLPPVTVLGNSARVSWGAAPEPVPVRLMTSGESARAFPVSCAVAATLKTELSAPYNEGAKAMT
jgi:hypothetical protein